MASRKSRNPFAFTPLPVTIIITFLYVGLVVALLITHHVVPSAPKSPSLFKGVNITEAWRDLQELSGGFHPYNSHRNDQVRDWLLTRIDDILLRSKIKYSTVGPLPAKSALQSWNATSHAPVVVFNDMTSNIAFSTERASQSVYFEGTNIIIYIRGTEDGDDDWWDVKPSQGRRTYTGKGGVLVNAHYDGVSTGFGATDDGVAVIAILQLISHFTTSGQRPKRGIVALLNNGEEDFLNGAWVFSQHPMSQFPHTFLNLEGAGAGGRASLFRSTDAEVTKYYKNARYPFGTVLSADGFKRGLIRSQTDYVVFNGELGLRGLDIAFMEPRARYHTADDSARETSKDSIWHMLSAAIPVVEGLSSDTSSTFEGLPDANDKLTSGCGNDGVWFDIFGRAFILITLRTLFNTSVALLVVTPVLLVLVHITLIRLDKWYLFAGKEHMNESDDTKPVLLYGWRGFFRFPFAMVVSTAAVVALALIIVKINPYIIYSSPYAIWSMFLSAWLTSTWFLLQSVNLIRESALQRAYILIWLYSIGWLVMVAATIGEDHFQLGSAYLLVIYFAAIFAALLVSYIEFFALPRKTEYVEDAVYHGGQTPTRHSSIFTGGRHADDQDADETTSLLRGEPPSRFTRYRRGRRVHNGPEDVVEQHPHLAEPFGKEQAWSGSLPSWTWLIQFILLAPIVVILVGQVALLYASAITQTPADGSPVLFIYVAMAVLSVLILLPISPFLHRFTYHIPTFLLLVFVGTLIYNLAAFPFSPNNRLKVFFQQQVDLETGTNNVTLTGLEPFVRDIVAEIPSAGGQPITCSPSDAERRSGLVTCTWTGLPPNVVASSNSSSSSVTTAHAYRNYKSWLTYNVTRPDPARNEATFTISGRNTRACKLVFTNTNISDFNVTGGSSDPRFRRVGKNGSKEIRLWSRDWRHEWEVTAAWSGGRVAGHDANGDDGGGEEQSKLEGDVVCLWSDQNERGVIPALDEVRRFMPVWSVVTKLGDGLVEGKKAFSV